MTNKVYKTAQGKSIDLGTIILKNEHVRAVGNMNVNARGDVLDQANNVIETKPQLIKRQNARLTNVSADPVQTSQRKTRTATKTKSEPVAKSEPVTKTEHVAKTQPVAKSAPVIEPEPELEPELETVEELFETEPEPEEILAEPPPQHLKTTEEYKGPEGLAGAIARTRQIKQELEKTRRQRQRAQGVRKL